MKNILVTGSAGQIGSELVVALRKKYGNKNVVAGVHRNQPNDDIKNSGPVEVVDATDIESIKTTVSKYNIDTIFHLASLLSAIGEKKPDIAWNVNVGSLKNILDTARELKLKIYWPSSIGAFGPGTPKEKTPQTTIMDPNTMYGITKVVGELLCNYYFLKYGVDARSLRYPGLIGWKTPPSQGTTEYAIEIFYGALEKGSYICPLKEDTVLPMMYMSDAIKATIDIMEAEPEKIKIRTSYNLAAFSFAPRDIAAEIKKYMPDFKCAYKPDFRQAIADSWPKIIDDTKAREDWGWKHSFDLSAMAKDMIENLSKKLGK